MSHGVYNYLPLGYESSTAPMNVVPSYLNATKDLLGDSILSALTRMILLTPNSSYSSHATRHSLFRMGYKEEDIRMSFQLWHARGMVGRARRADFAGRKFMLSNVARMAVYGKAADISLLRDGLACLEGDADSAGVVHAEPTGSWMQVLANCVAQGRVTLDCIWFPEASKALPGTQSDASIPNVEEEEHQSDAEDDELMEDHDDNEEGGDSAL
ncbi:hypothetical protein FOZ63_017409 [Perkinsus olseni]|uniref:Uncharacterized protein n=1 Tax=Perkinsus olseni TaxID=32597 RepID=A0A7J6UIW3_PEROL|nr:hypothetical protein FOZ63_017409 [Perkinsus olseni]